jgi:hypothetical protein
VKPAFSELGLVPRHQLLDLKDASLRPEVTRGLLRWPAAEAASKAEVATALLHGAVAIGYRSPDPFRTEDALDPLRGRDDFRRLMTDLAMTADPFGATR